MDWQDIWYANPGSFWHMLKWGSRWHIGIWTGPDNDLLCLKRCQSKKEAEQWLSPGGMTIKIAFFKAVIKCLHLKLRG